MQENTQIKTMPLHCRYKQVKTDHHGSIRGTANSHEMM